MKPNRFFLDEVNAPQKPIEVFTPPQKPEDKVKLGKGNSLPLYSLPKRVYRVHIKYPQTNHSIGYEITAHSLHVSMGMINIAYQKNNYFTQGKTPTKVLENLAIVCSNILYPINLTVNYETGEKQISNPEKIKERFALHLPRLQKDYKGELFGEYIRQIEYHLSDPRQFAYQLINQDLFFALFTHPIYRAYNQAREAESTLTLSVPGEDCFLSFTGKLKIDETYNCLAGFFLHFTGVATSLSGKQYQLDVEYNLDYADYTVKDILAEINTLEGEDKSTLVKLSSYQLREREPSSKEKEAKQQLEQQKLRKHDIENEKNYQKYLRSKRSWFDKLFNL